MTLVLEKCNLGPWKVLEFCTLSLLQTLIVADAGHWQSIRQCQHSASYLISILTCWSVIQSSLCNVCLYELILETTHTRYTSVCPGLPGRAGSRNVEAVWTQLVAVASAGSYASLHLTPDRQPHQHPTTQFFTDQMPFLPPNQQHQSTEGTDSGNWWWLMICLIGDTRSCGIQSLEYITGIWITAAFSAVEVAAKILFEFLIHKK